MGNPDLSAAAGPPGTSGSDEGLRPGLVIFPADEAVPAAERSRISPAGWLDEWWLIVGAVAVAALMIAIALMLR